MEADRLEAEYSAGYEQGREDALNEMLHFDQMQVQFMQACGQARFPIVQMLDSELSNEVLQAVSLWLSLIDEEVNKEFRPYIYDTFFGPIKPNSPEQRMDALVRIADDIGDSIYVLCGLANCLGIPLAEVYQEIHRSNMTKAIPVKNALGKVTGYTVKRREDGKILKPDNWEPPNIKAILRSTFIKMAHRDDSQRQR